MIRRKPEDVTWKKMWLKFEKYHPRHRSSFLRFRVKANTSQMPLEWQGELQSAVAVWVRHPGILFNRGGENFSSNFLLLLTYPVKMQFLTIQAHMILSSFEWEEDQGASLVVFRDLPCHWTNLCTCPWVWALMVTQGLAGQPSGWD